MANKTINLSKLKQMLRLYAQGGIKLKISELTGVSRNTLKKYLKTYSRLGLTIAYVEEKNDQELDHLFGENLLPEPTDRYKQLESFSPKIEKDLKKRGITRRVLWEKYIALHPDGFKVSQFKHHYQKWLNCSKPVMYIEHIAGDKMYVDFAGEKPHIVNKDTGELMDVEVFISVLGASRPAL
jgi:transposase